MLAVHTAVELQRGDLTLSIALMRKTVGTISGQILFAGQHASRTFLRRYTGYVEQFGECPE